MSIWETANELFQNKKLEGDWTNALSVTFFTLAEVSQEKNKNIFSTKKSLQLCSLLFF